MKNRLPNPILEQHAMPLEQHGAELIRRSLVQAENEGKHYNENSPFIAHPDNGWLICRRHVVTKTPGGINIPEVSQTAYFEIMAVGEGQVSITGARVPVIYKVGDIILTQSTPVGIIHEGVALFFINQNSVFTKIVKRENGL